MASHGGNPPHRTQPSPHNQGKCGPCAACIRHCSAEKPQTDEEIRPRSAEHRAARRMPHDGSWRHRDGTQATRAKRLYNPQKSSASVTAYPCTVIIVQHPRTRGCAPTAPRTIRTNRSHRGRPVGKYTGCPVPLGHTGARLSGSQFREAVRNASKAETWCWKAQISLFICFVESCRFAKSWLR